MWKTFDLKCEDCGNVFEVLTENVDNELCECGGQTYRAYTKAPGVLGCDSFNPHYDLQLGQHFQTKEEKDKFLKDTGRNQISGQASPRSDTSTSFRCSKKQAKKEFGISPKKKAWAASASKDA